MFYPYEGYRSVTPLDAARVNRTIFHNHFVVFLSYIKGSCYYTAVYVVVNRSYYVFMAWSKFQPLQLLSQ